MGGGGAGRQAGRQVCRQLAGDRPLTGRDATAVLYVPWRALWVRGGWGVVGSGGGLGWVFTGGGEGPWRASWGGVADPALQSARCAASRTRGGGGWLAARGERRWGGNLRGRSWRSPTPARPQPPSRSPLTSRSVAPGPPFSSFARLGSPVATRARATVTGVCHHWPDQGNTPTTGLPSSGRSRGTGRRLTLKQRE